MSVLMGAAGAGLITWLIPELKFWNWFAILTVNVFVLARIQARFARNNSRPAKADAEWLLAHAGEFERDGGQIPRRS